MPIELYVILPLLGLFVGLMAGMLGVGGGGILVPALSTVFLSLGYEASEVVHIALGTSMATIITTSISSARAHHRQGSVDWLSWRWLTPGVLVGTFLATFLVARLNAHFLAGFFAVFMALVALQMWRPMQVVSAHKPTASELIGVGGGIGGISALVSIGGGSLTVPYMVWRNHPMTRAVGTSAALGLPIAVTGTLGYLINGWAHSDLEQGFAGFIYLPAVLLLSLASALSAPIGVRIAHRLPVPVLKKVFAVLIVIISLRMFWQVWSAT